MNYEIFKNKFLRKTLASWCAFATLATMCGPAWAALTDASINRMSENVTDAGGASGIQNFTMTGASGVIDWTQLNVGVGEKLNFNSAGSWYNVVSGDDMSTIAGSINGASASVYIFNPNGVVFNSGSSVDVGGIFGAFATGVSGTKLDNWISNPTAVPAAIKNASMSGEIEINGGTFKASQLAFAGENVRVNGGTFEGATTLSAGDRVTIDGFGGGTISLTVPDADYGDIEFDGMSTFEDALVAKAGGEVLVGNNSQVTVKGANGFDISAEAFHVDNSKVDVTVGNLTANVSDRIAVMGTSSVKAKGDVSLTVADGNVAIADGFAASVKSEANVAITANGGDITMGKGGEIAGQNVALKATGTGSHKDITMAEGASITAKGTLGVETANGSINEDAGAKILATDTATFTATQGDITLAGTANDFSQGGVDKVVNAEAKTVTINEGGEVSGANTGISLGTVKATAGDVKVTDTTGTITAKGATVEATKGNVILSAAKDVVIGDDMTADGTFVKAGENIRIESRNGAVDIVSRVTAGKNLTIVSQKADAGSKVKIDAQYLTGNKNILTAGDGSIYIVAEANDIEINNGTIITATDSTKTDSSAAGNILLKSEIGSVTPAEGTARIVADNGKGVAALVGGGTVGNKNLTIKAGVIVLNSTGKGSDTPDVMAVFEGDTKLVAKAVHDVDVDIVGGTLTIDSQANALAGENVNEVLHSPASTPAVTLEKHELKAYANDSRGTEAGNDIRIQGYNANLVVAPDSLALAGHDITVNIDGNETVFGTMQAGNDIAQNIDGNITVFGTMQAGHNDYLTTGGNLATPGFGKIVAGKDLFVRVGTSTPMVNIAVGKGVSAQSKYERAIAFRTVGGYAYPEVYGNDSKTAVFIDGRIAGGNSADSSILQGYEQAAADGNFFLMPVFTPAANFFPLAGTTGLQSPDASFAQGYLTSDKGEISGIGGKNPEK